MATRSTATASAPPIAIVGVSALFPGSSHKQAFWRHIVAGRDFITDVPPDHWLVDDYYDPEPGKADKVFTQRGAFLPKVPFHPLEFGLPPNNLPSTDTVQLLALLGTKRLLAETHSVQSAKVARQNISVILGIAAGTELIGDMAARIQRPHWIEGMRRAGVPEPQVQAACDAIAATYPEWNESTFPGLLANVAAGRIANRFDLGGANCVIDAACASSLAALNLAVDELRLGKSELVISGGCDALNDIFMFMCFTRTPAMSRAGDCRPFADAADGTMLGEGVGLFALRRLADAERDGDTIYAVIRGIGSSSDGSAKSVYAPRAEGQASAIRRALAEAGVAPDDIGLIEAHGTATKAGDAAEAAGLRQAFASATRADTGWCALGSVKSQIGHTKSAAGAAGLFKTVMALRHRVLPPTIKVDQPNPALQLETSPFYLNTVARPWIHPAGTPRRAGLSSFGFGGSNFHVVVEEYLGATRAPRIATSPTHLVLVGGKSVDDLLARLEQFQAQVVDGSPLATVARTSQVAFAPASAHRLAMIANDAADFSALGRTAAEKLPAARQPLTLNGRLHYSAEAPAPRGSVAFLFPGQGSQYVGMGAELAMEFDAARAVWDRAAMATPAGTVPWDRLVFPIPVFNDGARQAQEAELTRTENAQPALGLTSLAALALLQQVGLAPDFVGGHSYGELVALFAAGVIPDEATLLALSATRGRLMAAAAEPAGTMLAILGPVAELEEILRPFGDTLTIANRNSPQQLVVSGRQETVAALEQRLATDARWTAARLPVAAAFHSPLVSSAAKGFARALDSIALRRPQIPVFANTTAAPYPADRTKIRSLLAGQLAAPVRFDAQIEAMYEAGARIFVEVGPRSVLSRLVAQILGERPHGAIALDQKGRSGVASFFEALGRLSVAGVPLDYAALWSEFETECPDPAAGPLARGAVSVGGANLGKPYPPANGAAGRTPPTVTTAPAPASVAASPASLSAASAPMSVPNHPSSDSAQRYALLEQVQRNVLEAQRHFQETLAQSHLAFLQTSEALLRQIGGVNGTPINGHAVPQSVLAAPTPSVAPTSGFVAPIVPRSLPPPPAPEPTSRVMPTPTAPPVMPHPPAFAAVVETPLAPLSAARSRYGTESAVAAPAAGPTPDYAALILATIARCTGYPVEMIQLDMELEAGLGIDSIKKVEIFSALQEQIPALAQAEASQVGTLATVRAILEFTESLTAPAPEGQKKKLLTPA